jgi:REP element-mobilizing transposase RayT
MIVGYHVIFSAYGFWLPNDPRGSWSDFVGSWELFRYGSATKTTETRSLAYRAHNRKQRLATKESLKRPPVQFTGIQARAVGQAFAAYFEQSRVPVWACAILPDHVHLVIGRPRIDVKQLVIQLKGAATRALLDEGIHPFGHLRDRQGRVPKCFARGQWKVYLDLDDVIRAIRYVEENPLKERKPRQRWKMVTDFNVSRSAARRG